MLLKTVSFEDSTKAIGNTALQSEVLVFYLSSVGKKCQGDRLVYKDFEKKLKFQARSMFKYCKPRSATTGRMIFSANRYLQDSQSHNSLVHLSKK